MCDEIIKIFFILLSDGYVELIDFTMPEFYNYTDKDSFVRTVFNEFKKRRNKDKTTINKFINATIKLDTHRYITFCNYDECEQFLINNFNKSYIICENLDKDFINVYRIDRKLFVKV